MIGTLQAHAATEDADLTARVTESRPEGDFVLAVHCGMQSIFGMMPGRGLLLETRLRRVLQGEAPDVREELASLNAALNEAFFGLFEPSQFHRFGGATEPTWWLAGLSS
jgi:hypothetical protein